MGAELVRGNSVYFIYLKHGYQFKTLLEGNRSLHLRDNSVYFVYLKQSYEFKTLL